MKIRSQTVCMFFAAGAGMLAWIVGARLFVWLAPFVAGSFSNTAIGVMLIGPAPILVALVVFARMNSAGLRAARDHAHRPRVDWMGVEPAPNGVRVVAGIASAVAALSGAKAGLETIGSLGDLRLEVRVFVEVGLAALALGAGYGVYRYSFVLVPDTTPRCNECGYNLTGTDTERCPECGTPR